MLHPSWNAAPLELRLAAEQIQAHPLCLYTGCSYDNLEHAAEALLQIGPIQFWKELEEEERLAAE